MCCVLCCVVVWCGVVCVWCGLCVWRFCVVFSLYFSQFSSFSFLLSLFPSLFFPSSLFYHLFSFLFLVFSSLPFTPPNTVERTDQPTRRPTGARQVHSSRFSPLLLSTPSSLLKKIRELFITGIFPPRNLFFITVLNKFQKLAAGENYRRYSFILIPKQLVCNASNL